MEHVLNYAMIALGGLFAAARLIEFCLSLFEKDSVTVP